MADLTAADDLALGPPYVVGANRTEDTAPAPEVTVPEDEPFVRFSKDEIDLFYERFGDIELKDADGNVYAEGPDANLASSLVRQFSRENPELFPGGYEGLVKSQTSQDFKSHPLWSALHGPFEKLQKKPISDVDLINFFARNEDGEKFEEGTFFGGMKREILPSVFSMSGAVAAGKTASRLTSPIPATTPVTAAVKFGVPLGAAVIGGLTGYKAGEGSANLLLGEEGPISPGTRIQYEMGKTAASGLGWLPTPYLISSKVNLGGAEYLTNLAKRRAELMGTKVDDVSFVKPKSKFGFRLQDTTVVPYLKSTKYVQDQGPRAARMVRFAETMLSTTGKSAKVAPIPLAIGEVAATAGSTLGTGVAESQYPGEALPRIGFELLFGTPFGLAGAGSEKLVAATSAAAEGFKNYGGIKGILKAFSVSRQNKGAQRIVEILEGQGYTSEDIAEIARKLGSDDIDNMLVDEAGNKISLTAGTKSGDPIMMAIEASIAQSSPTLGRARDTASEETSNMIRNQINALILAAKGGDQALNQGALQEIARITQSVFERGMVERLSKATDNVLAATQRVKGKDIDNAALGRQLFNVVDTQMELARKQEKALWQAVPNIEITTFRNADGEDIDVPNFISAWDNSVPRTKEAKDEVDSLLSPLAKFVERKREELNLAGDPMPELDMGFQRRLTELNERTQGLSVEAKAREIKAEQDSLIRVDAGSPQGDYFQYLQRMMDDGPAGEITPLTLVEVQDMRQKALSLGRRLRSSGDDNEARIAYAFAEGLLDDLNALEAVADASYQTARSYSRALNDTFTRTFAGDILGTAKTGEARIAPELLANRVLAGGVDPTLLRVNQLKNIATFMRTEGVPGSTPEDTLNTVSGSIEDMLRNVRAEAYREVRDPETGDITPRIDETALRGWLEKNKELLGDDGFAALRRDLEDSEKAEVILRQTQLKNKKRTRRLNNMKVLQNILPQVTESPIHAVGDAITGKAPVRDLNRLLKMADNKNLSESQRAAAKEGIKASILEYAQVKSGISGGGGDARTMYRTLFTGMEGSPSNMSPVDYMKSKGLITDSEAKTMETFLTELARVETAAVNGNLVDIAKEMGPMVDFYVSIAGSAAGTRAYNMMVGGSGPGAITAASRGQEFLRQVFSKVPESLKMDVMGELMTNPKLLADLLRKTSTQRERTGLLSSIKEQFQELGFIRPVRRELGSTFREVDDEIDQQITEQEVSSPPVDEPVPAPVLDTPTTSAVPVSPMRSVAPPPMSPAPSPVAMAPPPAAPAPSSGPVNREQYAALFPNDLASGMIRQQGTALMADGGAVKHFAAGGRADGPGSDNFGSEASQHGSGGGNDGGNDGGDQNRSMTPEERYADNARRLGQTYIGDDQNRSMTSEERYADNFARLSADLPQSTSLNSAVSLTVTPQEKRQVLSQVNKLAQQSLQPDAVIDFRQRLAAGQFDPQKAALNPAQARAAALNPTLVSFNQPMANTGITSLPSIQANPNIEQPAVAPETTFSGLPVGEGKLMGQYDPATGKVELVYTSQYARGGAVNFGIGNLFRRRV